MKYNIAVIPGDGIGPEIVTEARKCWIKWQVFMDTNLIMKNC